MILKKYTNPVQETNGSIERGQCRILPGFMDREYSSVIPSLGKVMDAEKRVAGTGEEGNR